MENKKLKQQVLNASFWTVAGFGFSQLIRLGSNLILTRLLIPELFGMMAIVTVLRVGVYMCSEIGLKVNVIRHEDGEKPEFINTAWTLQVIRGIIIWLIISLIAIVIHKIQVLGFFSETSIYSFSELPMVIIITGFSSVILGFESANVWLSQRYMTLGVITKIEILSQLLGISIMILWATKSPSVWALVAGNLIIAFMKTCLSHYLLPGNKNYFYFDKKIVIELLHFGKWLFLSAMITFFALNGDRLLLGGFLSAEELGIYTVAFFLIGAVKDMLEKLNFNVWFPLLSKICRENQKKISNVYYNIRLKQDFIVFILVGFLYATAPLIVNILYDSRYEASGWMFQILVFSLIGSCYRLGGFLMTAMGHPKVGTFAITTRAVALWASVPLSFHWFGVTGALWAIAINPLFDLPVIWWSFFKHGILCWYKEIMLFPIIGVGYSLGIVFLNLYELIEGNQLWNYLGF